MVDIDFSDFAFKTTGGTAVRTMPDRLAEERNVLEYSGVDPTGTTDSRAGIQAAVNSALTAGTGVYLPLGTYKITNNGSGSGVTIPGDADFGFYMRGAVGGGTILQNSGSVPGFLVDRSLSTPNNTKGPRVFENITFNNTTGGGLRIGSSLGVIVRGCAFGALGIGLTTEDTPGVSSQNIIIDTCNFGGSDLSSIGLVMGGSGVMTACDFNAIGTATILYGRGIKVNGSRCERCNTALMLGVDSVGTNQGLYGVTIVGHEMEGLGTFIDFAGTVDGFHIGPLGCTGHDQSNSGLGGHEINSQYGVRIRPNTAYNGTFTSVSTSQFIDVASVYIEDYAAPKRSGITFINCAPSFGAGGGVRWRIPANSAWPRFINSNCDSSTNAPYGTRYSYAGLPTGGDCFEGDEFDIYDANTSTIDATVASGGGSNRIHVRWNGSNWICLPG
jgi:hypothetical protein